MSNSLSGTQPRWEPLALPPLHFSAIVHKGVPLHIEPCSRDKYPWRGKSFNMEIAIYLPDDIAQRVQAQWEDVPRHVLESLALAWYQSGELSEEQVRRLLGYETRLEVHGFLKEHDVPLRYTLEDLEKDREAHRRLGL